MAELRRFSAGLRAALACVAVVASYLAVGSARAQEVEFRVTPDRTRIGQDESVSLRFSVRAEGAGWSLEGPNFQAPDFDEVQQFSNVFVESFYENGRFGVRQNRQLTQVLRPRRTGSLRISGLEVTVAGRTYRAEPLVIEVTPGGAGTPPPRGYGGGGAGLRGAGKRISGVPFFVRAEVDKARLYKGEQAIVSYYLYSRQRIMNAQVDKYPTLNGFLREELEMPIQQGRLDSDQVVLDGVPYARSLLVRYAAYPLKEGRLALDPLALKAQYFGSFGEGGEGGDDAGDDPFQTFFRQMGPKQHASRSEPVTLDVLPLPADGRPADFSGAVGSFTVAASVDKREVKAGEPLTLTLRIEGQGNLSAVAEPKAAWPDAVDLFESKGRSRGGRGGAGEKAFEYLLIPREEGELTLPAVSFSFFDPAAAAYVTRQTEPVTVRVLPGAPGAVAPRPSARPAAEAAPGDGAPASAEDLSLVPRALREAWARRVRDRRLGTIGALALLLAGAAVVGWLAARGLRRRREAARSSGREAEERTRRWRQIDALVRRGEGLDDAGLTQLYELLSSVVYDAVDARTGLGARAFAREDLARMILEEKRMNPEDWARCGRLLEYAEQVRFGGAAGGPADARARMTAWANEARLIAQGEKRG